MNIAVENVIPILIERQYLKNGHTQFEYNDGGVDEVISQFHMTSATVVKMNDDYFCGIRANHFVVEFGWSEAEEGDFLLITSNHKGFRMSVYFKIDDKILLQYFTELDRSIAVSDVKE